MICVTSNMHQNFRKISISKFFIFIQFSMKILKFLGSKNFRKFSIPKIFIFIQISMKIFGKKRKFSISKIFKNFRKVSLTFDIFKKSRWFFFIDRSKISLRIHFRSNWRRLNSLSIVFPSFCENFHFFLSHVQRLLRGWNRGSCDPHHKGGRCRATSVSWVAAKYH